jgi:hypothetical protein
MDDQERARLAFLADRDGRAETANWAQRTLRIYRAAVLDKRHFASTGEYRRKFILSYCAFKHWLAVSAKQ